MTFAARNFSSALEPREPPDESLGGPDAELKFRAANDQNSGHLESNQISSTTGVIATSASAPTQITTNR